MCEIRDNDVDSPSTELLSDHHDFKPLHLVSVWREPETLARRISVAIILPSGIDKRGFSIRVSNDGGYLELTVTWPTPLVRVETMHKKWLVSEGEDDFEKYHPKVMGFDMPLQNLRKRTSDSVKSVARIPLHFLVQSQMENYNLAWKDNTARMVYVDLRGRVR